MASGSLAFVHRYVAPVNSDLILVLLHGAGGNEFDLMRFGRAIAPGAGLLSPRGQIEINGAARFFACHSDREPLADDLPLRTHALANFLETAALHYGFARRRVVILGYASGATMAASLLLRRPQVVPACMLLRPMVPFEAETTIALDRHKVLIGAGRRDLLVSQRHPTRLTELLRRNNAAVDLYWSNGGHYLCDEDLTTAQTWLQWRGLLHADALREAA